MQASSSETRTIEIMIKSDDLSEIDYYHDIIVLSKPVLYIYNRTDAEEIRLMRMLTKYDYRYEFFERLLICY